MLRTGGDLITQVLARGNISTTSGYYTDTIIQNNVQAGYRWATSFHKWPFTEGRASTTFASLATNTAGDLEGEYPEGWKSDSIRMLQIGGKRVKKLNLEDYQIFREDLSGSDDRVFSDLGRLYFVNPNIDLSGTVTAYGQYTPAPLDLSDGTSSTSLTVFSDHEEDGNEAIVYEALSYGKLQEKKPQEAQYLHERAVQLLQGMWKRHEDEQYKYATHPARGGMWDRFDVLRGVEKDQLFKRDQFN